MTPPQTAIEIAKVCLRRAEKSDVRSNCELGLSLHRPNVC
jgi:hypothetical protein